MKLPEPELFMVKTANPSDRVNLGEVSLPYPEKLIADAVCRIMHITNTSKPIVTTKILLDLMDAQLEVLTENILDHQSVEERCFGPSRG